MKISQDVLQSLRCPKCLSEVVVNKDNVTCKNPGCEQSYPVINGVVIMLNEENSIFSIQDFIDHVPAPVDDASQHGLRKLGRLVPGISLNVRARQNYERFQSGLLSQGNSPSVLVVGGSTMGEGMQGFVQDDRVRLIETDVTLNGRTEMVCDCHDIPFEDQTFDGVIIQAVLEHVVDPYRCVSEVYRVLKPNGFVYAETPFMQQVHMGRYDFTRFTHLGHRRLFRHFREVDSGAVCGPGMSLAWAYQYFLVSFTNTRKQRWFAKAFAGFTSFYLKYFDYYLIDKPAALDAASGVYFLGQKSDAVLSDRELLEQYRGAMNIASV